MAKTYSDLLQETRAAIRQVSIDELKARVDRGEELVLVDVREKDEFRQGFIPGALHIARGFLEMQAGSRIPDKKAKVVTYCASGIRSAFAAKVLQDLGYENVESANPGYGDWKDKGYPIEVPFAFTPAQLDRYSRHLLLPEVGEKGQEKLLKSRVLLLGAGGLGAPAGLYLAAAGVGTLGIIDADHVDASNLQRQVIHGMDRVGMDKVESAKKTIENLNPDVNVLTFNARLDSSNIDRIFDQDWDVIVDGLDNFPTRYLVNDASVWKNIPVVHGSIFRFDGQVTTFWPKKGPCYRCLYPEPPPAHLAPSCAEGGVLGVLPGVIGVIQATEAIKIILGKGEPLVGRLLQYDSLDMAFKRFKLRRDPECPVCGDHPTITEYIDYEGFCSAANG
jgi:molybdopterin/thiamine biosynthesis adenylyltransferase/rhodanese-related sulfurtransferase